jgi:hypothetical protein
MPSNGMRLITYQSRTTPAVYVTMPMLEAAAIFSIVERLAPMRLIELRCGYSLADEDDREFVEFVTREIAQSGYAVHGHHAWTAARPQNCA